MGPIGQAATADLPNTSLQSVRSLCACYWIDARTMAISDAIILKFCLVDKPDHIESQWEVWLWQENHASCPVGRRARLLIGASGLSNTCHLTNLRSFSHDGIFFEISVMDGRPE